MASKKSLQDASANMTSSLFSVQKAAGDTETKQTNNPKATKKKAPEKAATKSKKVFSFRAEEDAVTSWRLYADASGMKVDDLGASAIEDYIKAHPLTKDQKTIYNLKMKSENMKSKIMKS